MLRRPARGDGGEACGGGGDGWELSNPANGDELLGGGGGGAVLGGGRNVPGRRPAEGGGGSTKEPGPIDGGGGLDEGGGRKEGDPDCGFPPDFVFINSCCNGLTAADVCWGT